MDNLEIRFRSLWTSLGLSGIPTDTYKWLEKQYSGPDRAYHTLEHVGEGLQVIETIAKPIYENMSDGGKQATDALRFAFWFHDSLPTEVRSADVARFVLWTGRRADLCDPVQRLIELTKHTIEPENSLERIMIDADLAIFAADTERFDRYESDVRKEYAKYSDAQYNAGRIEVLNRFLARPTIYYSIFGRREYEAKARTNLARSIERLTGA